MGFNPKKFIDDGVADCTLEPLIVADCINPFIFDISATCFIISRCPLIISFLRAFSSLSGRLTGSLESETGVSDFSNFFAGVELLFEVGFGLEFELEFEVELAVTSGFLGFAPFSFSNLDLSTFNLYMYFS